MAPASRVTLGHFGHVILCDNPLVLINTYGCLVWPSCHDCQATIAIVPDAADRLVAQSSAPDFPFSLLYFLVCCILSLRWRRINEMSKSWPLRVSSLFFGLSKEEEGPH